MKNLVLVMTILLLSLGSFGQDVKVEVKEKKQEVRVKRPQTTTTRHYPRTKKYTRRSGHHYSKGHHKHHTKTKRVLR